MQRTVMPARTRTYSLLTLLLLCLSIFNIRTASAASPPDHWVGTSAACPVPAQNLGGPFSTDDSTYREIVHVSLGAPIVRIVLSNEFGLAPLTIGEAHIAPSA